MTQEQLNNLWAFSRGDVTSIEFESWLYKQTGLESALGDDLNWTLLAADYRDRDIVFQLRKDVATYLAPWRQCECPAIPDCAAIPMGDDFYYQAVFKTLKEKLAFGSTKWWLYFSECQICLTVWLIAQDDRIYDDFFFARSNAKQLADAVAGHWPEQFQTYEEVLATGRRLSTPPKFFDPMSCSLQWTVEDLLAERPGITAKEIGFLLGLSEAHGSALLQAIAK